MFYNKPKHYDLTDISNQRGIFYNFLKILKQDFNEKIFDYNRKDQKLKLFPPKNFPIQSKLTSQILIKVLKSSKMMKNTLK